MKLICGNDVTMEEEKVQQNLNIVLNKIKNASQRTPTVLRTKEPILVAATKIKAANLVAAAYRSGQRDFGENYVQELEEKANALVEKCPEIRWHFIGHLQTNKINKLLNIPNLHMIQTVHSKKLAEHLDKSWEKLGKNNKMFDIMVQVNTSREEEKSGVPPEETTDLVEYVLKNCKNLRLRGLMTIGKYYYNPALGPNPDFLTLRKCREEVCSKLNLDLTQFDLSMGMSTDFEQAVEMGSTIVRVGENIFGPRDSKPPPAEKCDEKCT